MKKFLIIGLFLLTGCVEPSIIIREETLKVIVTNTEFVMVVRGRSSNRITIGYGTNPNIHRINLYSRCDLNKFIQ